MFSSPTSRDMWRAVICTAVLRLLSVHAKQQARHAFNETTVNSTPEGFFDVEPTGSQVLVDNAEGAMTWSFILARSLAESTLAYTCHRWLERRFPARGTRDPQHAGSLTGVKRPTSDENGHVKDKTDYHMAEGRAQVRRISWANTIAKWLIYNMIGIFVLSVVATCFDTVLVGALNVGSMPLEALCIFALSSLMGRLIEYWFCFNPLVSLLSLVFLPAQYRLYLEVAGDLAQTVIFDVFCRLFIPWLFRTDWMRQGFQAYEEFKQETNTTMSADGKKLVDEL